MIVRNALVHSGCWFKPTCGDEEAGFIKIVPVGAARWRRKIDETGADSFIKVHPMNTIVINNQKGGVGKTTLAVHLAWFMAEAGRRVLMIDVDAQGNATDTLKQHTGSTSAADLFKPATRVVAG
jgi:Mrp family chromosome partitioning ATPase